MLVHLAGKTFSLLFFFFFFFRVINEDSSRDLYVDGACSSGEVDWRMTKTFVTLRFRRPSPFSVCFSSKFPVGYEKFGVYNLSYYHLFVGSPNIGKNFFVGLRVVLFFFFEGGGVIYKFKLSIVFFSSQNK